MDAVQPFSRPISLQKEITSGINMAYKAFSIYNNPELSLHRARGLGQGPL